MSILLYAISRDDARAPAAGELHEICSAGLRALAEPLQEPLTADLEELVHYEETVETVMRRHTILPMRFGSVAGDEQEVRDLLKARAREFGSALAQLDGAVEFGVQASIDAGSSPTPSEPAAAGPGESYMRTRLQQHRCRRRLQDWLDAELTDVVRARVYRTTPVSRPESIGAAYLVENEQTFVERLERLALTAGRTLTWSGPWPPYTFVDGLER